MSVYFDYLLDRDLVRHVAQASNERREICSQNGRSGCPACLSKN